MIPTLGKVFFNIAAVLLVTCSTSMSADRTLTLTSEQETVLLYTTEQVNVLREGGVGTDGLPLEPLTPLEVLAKRVAKDLAEQQRIMDARLAEFVSTLKVLDALTLQQILNVSPASPALKQRLQERLVIR